MAETLERIRKISYLPVFHTILFFKHGTVFQANKFVLFVVQTGVALGIELDDKMPQHEYYEYFGPDYALHVAPSNMENKNSRHLLDEIRAKLLDNLSRLQHAPSVPFQERPPDTELREVAFASTDNTLLFILHFFMLHFS